jgi:hypothetical protein
MAGTESGQAFAAWAARLDGPAPGPGARPLARSYRELWGEAAALVGAGAARAERYGTSAEGEPLWALDVRPPGARGAILVVAGLHAMEHVGPLTALALVARAAASPSWSRRRLVVAPLANPDGFRAVERARVAGARRFQRGNARGVDLNRNFAEGWDGGYYLSRLFPRVFAAGAGPLSEPESAALDALAGAVRPAAAVSLHAFGEWIYVPWAGRREAPPDLDRHLELARAMAARQPRPYRVMQLARRSRLFAARGAELDHFYGRHRALSFLIEVGAGPRLGTPGGWLDPYRWFTPDAAALAADVAAVLPALDALAEAELPAR